MYNLATEEAAAEEEKKGYWNELTVSSYKKLPNKLPTELLLKKTDWGASGVSTKCFK